MSLCFGQVLNNMVKMKVSHGLILHVSAIDPGPGIGTRDPGPGIRAPGSGTRDPGPGTRGSGPGVRDPGFGTRVRELRVS